MTEEKKAVFETTREADERLRNIREKEKQQLERLLEIRREEVAVSYTHLTLPTNREV